MERDQLVKDHMPVVVDVLAQVMKKDAAASRYVW